MLPMFNEVACPYRASVKPEGCLTFEGRAVTAGDASGGDHSQ
jgi:hypothetical protein